MGTSRERVAPLGNAGVALPRFIPFDDGRFDSPLAPYPGVRGASLSGGLQLLHRLERANRIRLVLAETGREQPLQQPRRLRLAFEGRPLSVFDVEQPTRRKFAYRKPQVFALTKVGAKPCSLLPATPSWPELPTDLLVARSTVRARHFDAAFKRVTVNVTQRRHAQARAQRHHVPVRLLPHRQPARRGIVPPELLRRPRSQGRALAILRQQRQVRRAEVLGLLASHDADKFGLGALRKTGRRMQPRGWDRDDQRISSSSRHGKDLTTSSLNRRERGRNNILGDKKARKSARCSPLICRQESMVPRGMRRLVGFNAFRQVVRYARRRVPRSRRSPEKRCPPGL